jgi:hypothetical protein
VPFKFNLPHYNAIFTRNVDIAMANSPRGKGMGGGFGDLESHPVGSNTGVAHAVAGGAGTTAAAAGGVILMM